MSQVIEDETFFFNKPDRSIPKRTINASIPPQKKFLYENQLHLKFFDPIVFYYFKEADRTVRWIVIPFRKKLFNLVDVWYKAKLNHEFLYNQQKIIIALRDLPYHIQHFKKKLQAIREICANRQGLPKFVKMYITNEGIIELMIPKLVLSENFVNSFRPNFKNLYKAQPFKAYVENLVNFCTNDVKHTIKNIFKVLTTDLIKEEYTQKQADKQMQASANKFDLYRYLARSQIELRFDYSQGSALYEQVVDITLAEEKQISERIRIMTEANQFQLNTLNLYFEPMRIFEGKQMEAFYTTAKQKQIIKNMIQIPQVVPTKQANNSTSSIFENKYIFNDIVLQLPIQNQNLKLLAESGFGIIQYGTFCFWYKMDSKVNQSEFDDSFKQVNMIKAKYLVVKSPKIANNRKSISKYKAKQIHQLEIINKLNGISCTLIPRFYRVERFYPNQPYNSFHREYIQKYKNALLSELTCCFGQPGFNLGNMIEQHWKTLTLKKIIYIMSQIAQGLRFLHINKIVHLDIKPQNILLLKGLSIKIIDFGEAYHPQVPYRDQTPAYSYPYGCPQIVQGLKVFIEKCDVFSFGMILFELIYGRDLIDVDPSRLLREYRTQIFGKRLIFNVEEMENYGDNFILPMLNHIIVKSLSPDINSRPSMTWISVLLKKFLEILH